MSKLHSPLMHLQSRNRCYEARQIVRKGPSRIAPGLGWYVSVSCASVPHTGTLFGAWPRPVKCWSPLGLLGLAPRLILAELSIISRKSLPWPTEVGRSPCGVARSGVTTSLARTSFHQLISPDSVLLSAIHVSDIHSIYLTLSFPRKKIKIQHLHPVSHPNCNGPSSPPRYSGLALRATSTKAQRLQLSSFSNLSVCRSYYK